MSGNNVDIVAIRGPLEPGDYTTFIGLLRPNAKILVVLASPGGKIIDALKIGELIRLRGYSTTVVDNDECYSACALIWLSGRIRFMTSRSKIGFHAAYVVTDGVAKEKGSANAEIGSYLTRLGLDIDAIRFFTEAPPETVQLLDFSTAEALNIEVNDSGSLPIDPAPKPRMADPSFDCRRAGTTSLVSEITEQLATHAPKGGQVMRTPSAGRSTESDVVQTAASDSRLKS